MRLANATTVLRTMGVAENPGSLQNANRALDLSFPILENLLETSFGEAQLTDYFDTIRGELCLRLTNRFIDPDTIMVRVSTDGLPLVTPTAGDLLDATAYSLDPDKGLITLRNQPRLGEGMVSVTYDSGLPATDEDENVLEAPQWLQECAVAVAVHVLNTFPSSPANRKDKTVVNIAAEIRHLASQLVNSRKRIRMTVTFPTVSVVHE